MGKRVIQSLNPVPAVPATDSVLFEHLFEHSPDGIVLVDARDRIVRVNSAFEALFGYASQECVGGHINDLLVDPDFRDEAGGLSRQVPAGHPVRVESVRRARDGSLSHVEVTGVPIRTAQGQIGIFGIYRDIDSRHNAEEMLRQREQQYRHIVETLIDGYFELDVDGLLTFCNRAFRDILDLAESEVAGFQPLRQVSARRQLLHRVLRAARANAVARSLSLDVHTCAGRARTVECSVSAIRGASDRIVGFRGTLRDVTEHRRKSRKIAWQAEHDPLTGLYNRRKFESACEALLNAPREEAGHCLLYLDLDQFKLVNDSCGHHVGDRLLCELASLMRHQLRRTDLLARLGGDEFALLLENCSLDEGMAVAEKLVLTINDFEFVWQQHRFHVGVSIGVVELLPETTLVEALQAADQACYMAKDKGRNRISAFRPEDQEQQRHGIELRTALGLTEALRNNRFRLYFQRIEALNQDLSGQHCEILLRMLDEDGQLVSPAVFIPAAERFDKILMLDRWVVEHTLEALGRAEARGEVGANDRFAINLSGATFSHPGSLPFVIDRLRESGVNPCNVCFEITESNAISRWSDAQHFIEEIRRLGCLISLDDFGSGFSSFGYLKRLPIDAIKIDGGLVGDMRSSRLGRAMVGGIAQIARVASIPCVAEQVEQIEDLALLRELGIDYAQGFCLHRPEPWPWAALD